jgi:SHAQKYF class myb-like DNA-binding protein
MVHSTIFSVDAEAVPKRILELMNVEKLTRENVASHLQASHLPTLFNLASTSNSKNYLV